MYNTSTEFQDNIYAQSRTIKGRLVFNISDVTAREDIQSTTVSAEFIMSDKAQLIDLKRDLNNYITCETDRVKLDGSFFFANLSTLKETGYVSNEVSDTSGEFIVDPTISFVFSEPHSSIGITVTFDTINQEHAEDFSIVAYDGFGAVIVQENYVGNTESQVVAEGLFANYERLDIIVTKWNKGFRRVRVAQVDFGVVRTYTDETLVSMDLIEDVDYLKKVVPTSELTFVVQNVDREFNLLNPSGIYKFLQEKQQVLPEVGVLVNGVVEYVPLGEFFLSEWASEEGATTAQFKARDILDLMSEFEFESLTPKVGYSVYTMIEDLFTYCGITDYSIDSSLNAIETNGLVELMDCRTILSMATLLGQSQAYTDRNGTVIVKPLELSTLDSTITRDDMFAESKITLDKLYKTISVDYYTDLATKATVSASTGNAVGEILSYTNNTLVNTSAQATDIINMVKTLITYRAKFQTNYRGNPSYELLDSIGIEDLYEITSNTIVTKLELSYQGYLRGKIETRGVLT